MSDFREITIPGDVLDDDRLSDAAKILYGKIARLSYKNGYCWASNKFLDGTKSGNTASRNIHNLEKYGYVKCVYENNGQDRKIYIYAIDSRVMRNTPPPPADKPTGNGERVSPEMVKPLTGNGERVSPEMVNKHLNINIQNKHTKRTSVCEENKKHFIKLWQSHPDVFNPITGLQKPNDFDNWWEKNDLTTEMIDTAIKNFVDGVRDGSIPRRFIPGRPDTFVLNGGIQRYQTPYRSRASPNTEMSPEGLSELDKSITGVKL
jgi:hypothetical protein